MSARPPGGCCMFSVWAALRVRQRMNMLPDMRQSHQHGPFIVCFYCFYSWIFLIVLAFARPGSVSWVSIFPMCSALWRAISPLVGRYRRQIPLCVPWGLSTRENSSLPRLNLEGFCFPCSSAWTMCVVPYVNPGRAFHLFLDVEYKQVYLGLLSGDTVRDGTERGRRG